LLIPAYNEGEALTPTLSALLGARRVAGVRSELVIVHDGTSDNTAAVIEALQTAYPEVNGVYNARRHGLGYAVRRGIKFASGGVVATTMVNESGTPADLLRCLEFIRQGHDCALRSRIGAGATLGNYLRLKLLLNRVGNLIMARLARSTYDDFTSGCKAHRCEVVERMLPLPLRQFNLTVEIYIKAVLSGARFGVKANDWMQREAGSSSSDVLKQLLFYLVTIHWVLTEGPRLMWLIEKPARVDGA
jgi:glycosyltransferase involved in cell wall biosynthesis